MDDLASRHSRRALLGAFTTAPVMALAAPIRAPWSGTLTRLYTDYDDRPATLVRTEAGRSLSRQRYRTAESFFPDEDTRTLLRWRHFLYYAGITAQLGLAAHLLDVGFSDDWCARQVGLRVAKSLAYANATGLGHDCPDMARLADILTPYWIWNRPVLIGDPAPDDGGFSSEQVRTLLCALLDHIGQVTGHRVASRRHARDRREVRHG